MRTMFDSTTAGDIPLTADIVAGYVDGFYAWRISDWTRFPEATPKVGISCLGTDVGMVLDIEAGCCSPWDAPGWIQRRQAAGIARPVVYVNRSNWGQTGSFCLGLEYDVWLADPTGVPHLEPGTVATQYATPAFGSGGHYDKSLVADGWLQGGSMLLDVPQSTQLQEIDDLSKANHNMLRDGVNPGEPSYLQVITASQNQILAAINALAPGGFTVVDRATLNSLVAGITALGQAIGRIETALNSGLFPHTPA